jgi:hypothetical protein
MTIPESFSRGIHRHAPLPLAKGLGGSCLDFIALPSRVYHVNARVKTAARRLAVVSGSREPLLSLPTTRKLSDFARFRRT